MPFSAWARPTGVRTASRTTTSCIWHSLSDWLTRAKGVGSKIRREPMCRPTAGGAKALGHAQRRFGRGERRHAAPADAAVRVVERACAEADAVATDLLGHLEPDPLVHGQA